MVDAGWNIAKLVNRLGIDTKFINTNNELGIQRVPTKFLNLIYNATDVGLNTGLGEGWGLPNVEHAITGAPQIVPDSSACRELFSDCGLLIPSTLDYVYEATLTVGKVVSPEDVAEQMEILYSNKDLYNILSVAAKNKFLDKKYTWEDISKQFIKAFNDAWR